MRVSSSYAALPPFAGYSPHWVNSAEKSISPGLQRRGVHSLGSAPAARVAVNSEPAMAIPAGAAGCHLQICRLPQT